VNTELQTFSLTSYKPARLLGKVSVMATPTGFEPVTLSLEG
jgi:hypothetical protein